MYDRVTFDVPQSYCSRATAYLIIYSTSRFLIMVEASTAMLMTCIHMCQPKEIINLINVLRILDIGS